MEVSLSIDTWNKNIKSILIKKKKKQGNDSRIMDRKKHGRNSANWCFVYSKSLFKYDDHLITMWYYKLNKSYVWMGSKNSKSTVLSSNREKVT